MLTRAKFIEQILRQIYGTYPSDDSSITPMLVNQYLDQAIAFAAKTNYTDNIKLDGIGYVNNSFYTTFKGIAITKDETGLWKLELPQVPVGIGANEGVSTLVLKDDKNKISLPLVPLTENQKTYFQSMQNLPFKTLYYVEGSYAYIISSLKLSDYTATVTLVSGGDSTDLSSNLNVPGDYIPAVIQFIQQQLMLMKTTSRDLANDGNDLSQN
jgi:hypothetical protein